MTSIQRKLTLNLVVSASILLVAAAVSIDRILSGELKQEFDEGLLSKARVIAGLVERDGDVIEFDRITGFLPEFEYREPREYFELRVENGDIVYTSHSPRVFSLVDMPDATGRPRFQRVSFPNREPGRLVAFSFAPRIESDEPAGQSGDITSDAADEDEDEVTYDLAPEEAAGNPRVSVFVARETAELEHLIFVSRATVGTGFAILVISLALLTRFSVNANLNPLRRFSSEVEVLDEHKLHKRVWMAREIKELEPIARQLNRLLDRLERAFEREKRFSGNVAHELKTPISELRTMSEVGRKWAGDREMVEQFFGDMVNLADDMERTVSNLLTLSRLDAGSQKTEMTDVDLNCIVDETWSRFRDTAAERRIMIDNGLPPNTYIRTDESMFRMMIANIISNAVTYSRENTTVTVRFTGSGERTAVELCNISGDLVEADLEFMRERFWRKDPSRSGSVHAGLGLSLIAQLAELLAITLDLKLEHGGRFIVSLSGLKQVEPRPAAPEAEPPAQGAPQSHGKQA